MSSLLLLNLCTGLFLLGQYNEIDSRLAASAVREKNSMIIINGTNIGRVVVYGDFETKRMAKYHTSQGYVNG